jgi:hypothetical protein
MKGRKLISLDLEKPEQETDKPSFKEQLGRLSFSQLGALIGIVISLVTASSGVTWYLLSNTNQAKEIRSQIQVEELEKRINKLKAELRVQEKLSVYLLKRDRFRNSDVIPVRLPPGARKPSDRNSQQNQFQAAHQLAGHIDKLIESNEKDENGIPDVHVLSVPYGTPADSKLEFRGHPPVEVPQEVKPLTKVATWIKSTITPLEKVKRALPREMSTESQRRQSERYQSDGLLRPAILDRRSFPTAQPTRDSNLLIRDKQRESQY